MYTRVYTESSPRKLVSGKGPLGQALSPEELRVEFLNHANRQSQEPTRLVSVSSRIIDTVQRACEKRHRDDEPAANIWFVFISVPTYTAGKGDAAIVHHAERLAKTFGHKTPGMFRYEYLFEGFIPQSLVVHRISLKTLLDRALKQNKEIHSILKLRHESTDHFRTRIAKDIGCITNQSGFWDVGIWLGCFARLFGARARTGWIAYQLFFDCVKCIHKYEDVFRLSYHGNREASYVDASDLKDIVDEINDGIDTVLIDWWFTTDKFIADWKVYKGKRRATKDHVSRRIGEFVGKWRNEERTGMQKADHDREWAEVCHEIDRQREALEQYAICIGL